MSEAVKSHNPPTRRRSWAFGGGALVGILGGLVGLGGAEFRLPLFIWLYRFGPLESVILNKAMSLIVVASALPLRARAVPLASIAAHWPIVVNLLAGSLLGAWLGAGWATRLKTATLYKVISLLLLGIAIILLVGHNTVSTGHPLFEGSALLVVGLLSGFCIGVVAAILGVAGGELLIPTLVLLFGADIRLAGSLSLAVSLPTMIVGFARYSRDSSFAVLSRNRIFAGFMAAGSIFGSFLGAQLLGIVPNSVLLPILAAILLVSSVKLWRHQ
jgi:uncharacterized membrane protein YfcA